MPIVNDNQIREIRLQRQAEIEEVEKEVFNNFRIWFAKKYSEISLTDSMPVRLNDYRRKGRPSYRSSFIAKVQLENLPNPASFPVPLRYLYTYVNYIQMSPECGHFHEGAYVIPEGKGPEDFDKKLLYEKPFNINSNYGTYLAWVNYLIKKARDLVGYTKRDVLDLMGTTLFILGDPGSGKTQLLNYTFSVYCDAFVENKIIWIRVNLNNVKNDDVDLERRLLYKFIRIIVGYYAWEEDSYRIDSGMMEKMKGTLTDRLRALYRNPNIERRFFELILDNFYKALRMIKYNELNSEPYDLESIFRDYYISDDDRDVLIKEMRVYIQQQFNFGYIFMFDGLDNVTLDKIQVKIYDKWIESIISVAVNKENSHFKAVYLITSRIYSFLSKKITNIVSEKQGVPKICLTTISRHNFTEIIEKRFRYVIGKMEDEGITEIPSEGEFQQIAQNLLDIVNLTLLGMSAAQYSLKYIDVFEDSNTKSDGNPFRQITNSNYRIAMRFLRLLIGHVANLLGENAYRILKLERGINHFLKYVEGKEWTFYRLLIEGHDGSEPYSNRIAYLEDGAAFLRTGYRGIIHNLFNYNDKGYDGSKLIPRNLLKFHAIALLGKEGKLSMNMLVNKLMEIYPELPRNLVQSDIDELCYNNIICPDRLSEQNLNSDDSEVSNYLVILSRSARFLSNRVLSKSIYYETVIDDTPIPAEFAMYLKPMHYNDKTAKDDIEGYLLLKTKSIYLFTLFIDMLQYQIMIEYEARFGEGSFKNNMLNVFSSANVDEIRNGIARYLLGHSLECNENEHNKFIAKLKNMVIYED